MRVHDAAHAAVDHTAKQDTLQATVNPAHPEYAAISGKVLRNPSLGSRVTSSVSTAHPPTVGSASVYANPGGGAIPPAVQQAIASLGTNSQANNLTQILNRVLAGTTQGQGASGPATQAQNDYFASQAALNTTRNQILQAPGQVAGQISSWEAKNPPQTGIMSLNPAAPGMYNPANDNALQSLYAKQTEARNMGTSGWTGAANARWM